MSDWLCWAWTVGGVQARQSIYTPLTLGSVWGPRAGLWVPGMHCACVTLPHCSGTWCAALDLSASLWSSPTPAPWGLNPELLLPETLHPSYPSPGDMHQAPNTPKALGRASQLPVLCRVHQPWYRAPPDLRRAHPPSSQPGAGYGRPAFRI